MIEIKRKGSKSTKDIPVEILGQLNRGEIETANLVEWLAVDQSLLIENVLRQTERISYLTQILTDIGKLKKQTVNTINETIGNGIFNLAVENNDSELLSIISNHTSDVVRCWAAYATSKNSQLTLGQLLEHIKHFAADKHFGVREIAWLAIRQTIATNLRESIECLSKWTANKDEYIRRFACEATRPRGVWCGHIEELKEHPEKGLSILEPLKADKSKYVRNSVGNWLNDASKTQPEFVKNVCEKWKTESPTNETNYIIKKALRSIEK